MTFSPRLLAFALFVAMTAAALRADVTLAPLFTDHAVLQRDKLVPVWGKADAGESVIVTFKGQIRQTTTAGDGRWVVLFDPLPADSQGAELTVAGKNNLVVHDVVVGEVWLCSGQSNMEFTVGRAANAAQEIAASNFPLIRHVHVRDVPSAAPADTVGTDGWKLASPQTTGGFTAVGYFFARDIFQKLNVPVGLVHSSWGGTPIESWMSPAALAGNPAFKVVDERWQKAVADFPAANANYESVTLPTWTRAQAAAKADAAAKAKANPRLKAADLEADWLKAHPRPVVPIGGSTSAWTPRALFNGMINPLVPYALRGFLWYQGEANAARASEYHALFAAMITAWRAHFGQGDVPFYWVSLANFRANGETAPVQTYAFLREAQTQTLSLPNTGQALAIDIGNPADVHPTNKQDVGRRLALLAKNRVYGVTGDDTGPTFAGARREGSAMRVKLTHAGGLIAHDKPVQSLEVAGADKVFHPATAVIDKETLLVSAPEVREPVAVRYAWKNTPLANLYNGAGLPAVPFRSDEW